MTPAEFRTMREGARLTQKELGDAIGRTPTTISRIETGAVMLSRIVEIAARSVCEKLGREK